MELELSGSMSLLESGDEFAAEDLAENPDREEELVVTGANPASVVRRQATSGDDAMDVGMMLQLLVPGVQDTEKADLGAEMLGVGSDSKQCLGAAAEQQRVDHGFVLQGQRCQLVRQREDDMRIGCSEQLSASRSQPAVARLALTLWAMPVAAGIIGDGTMAAA